MEHKRPNLDTSFSDMESDNPKVKYVVHKYT